MRSKVYQQILKSLDTKSKIAVANDTEKFLYMDLKIEIQKFCFFIQKTYSGRVMICGNQSFESYSALLASYLCGGTFCFLNPNLPIKRQKQIFESYKPEIVFYENDCAKIDFKGLAVSFSQVNTYTYEIYNNESNISQKYQNDILYVYYTSGSTGLPKGCMIKRLGFEKFCIEAVKILKLSENDICGQYVPLWFDMSLIDVFGGVMKQVTLVPFRKGCYKYRPGKYIAKHKITFINVVPQFLDILQNGDNLDQKHLDTLRMIRFGGDKISKIKLETLFNACENIEIVSTYGTTETTCFCLYKVLNKENYKKNCSTHATVGGPIKGWYAYLNNVDKEGIGELVIYGNNIGLGYVDEEQENKRNQKIYINQKWYTAYNTGDYFQIINNDYYFVGRKDTQVKKSGIRFDLNEIEYELHLLGFPNTCAILNDEDIYLFCEKKAEQQISTDNIMQKLKSNLPSFEMPKQIVFMNNIPYNSNGKIDRNKLKGFIIRGKL